MNRKSVEERRELFLAQARDELEFVKKQDARIRELEQALAGLEKTITQDLPRLEQQNNELKSAYKVLCDADRADSQTFKILQDKCENLERENARLRSALAQIEQHPWQNHRVAYQNNTLCWDNDNDRNNLAHGIVVGVETCAGIAREALQKEGRDDKKKT